MHCLYETLYFDVLQGRHMSAAQRHAARLRAAAGSMGTGSDAETASFINSDDDHDDEDDGASKFSATTETTEQSSKYGRQRQRRRRHHMPVMTRVNFHISFSFGFYVISNAFGIYLSSNMNIFLY
jgi:hypothetical protein